MTRRFRGALLPTSPLVILCWLAVCSTATATEEAPPLLTDAEEYSVMAAVLFPAEPEPVPGASLPPQVRLDGVLAGHYSLSLLTNTESITPPGSDPEMAADYNLKNARACRIDIEKLQALVQGTGRLDPASSTNGDNLVGEGVTWLSRPGFNRDRTRAMLQINHIASPEMGAGYLVFLRKSPSGHWLLTGAEMTRMY